MSWSPTTGRQALLLGETRDFDPSHWGPSASLAFAITSGWSKYVVAATIALARFKGSSDLNMPDPTNMPSAHQSSLDTPDVWSWIQARTSRACSFGGKIG